jgi:hypothetical protein
MVDFDKLKALGNDLLGKAGDLASKAKEKAGPLAEQAKEKAGPLAEQAKEKAGPLTDKAKDVAAKGADLAAGGIDKATGGKYHDKIEAVQEKVETALGQKDAGDAADEAAAKTKDAIADITPDPAVPTDAPFNEGAGTESTGTGAGSGTGTDAL